MRKSCFCLLLTLMVIVEWQIGEVESLHDLVLVRVPLDLGELWAGVALLPDKLVRGLGVLQKENGVRVAAAIPVGDGHFGRTTRHLQQPAKNELTEERKCKDLLKQFCKIPF